jgi:hypothetical protein
MNSDEQRYEQALFSPFLKIGCEQGVFSRASDHAQAAPNAHNVALTSHNNLRFSTYNAMAWQPGGYIHVLHVMI